MTSPRKRGGWPEWRPWLWVAIGASLWSFGLARHDGASHSFGFTGTYSIFDDGVANLLPQQILDGRIPYRDFEPRFIPLGWYVGAAWLGLFGEDMWVLRLMYATVNVCTSVLVFGMARRTGAGSWAYLAPLGTTLWGCTEYNVATPRWMAVLVALAACAWLARDGLRPRNTTVALAGLGLGVSLLLAQNTGVFALAAAAYALCLWSSARPAHARTEGKRWTAVLPFGGAALTATVVAAAVEDAVPFLRWMFAGPGFLFAAFLGGTAAYHRALTVGAGVRLIFHLGLVGLCAAVPMLGFGLWVASQAGWAPVLQSVIASATSLANAYRYIPAAPPVAAGWAVAAWGAAFALLALPLTAQERPARRGWAASVFFLLGALTTLGLAPRLAVALGSTPLAYGLQVAQGLLNGAWMYLLWALAVAVSAATTMRVTCLRPDSDMSGWAMRSMAGLAALCYWGHLYPLADYNHALWAVPPATVAFTVAVVWIARRASAMWSADLAWPRRRHWLAGTVGLLPAAILMALLVKWGTYFFVLPPELNVQGLRPRTFRLLDTTRARVWVDSAQANDWRRVFTTVRARTSPEESLVGLPHLAVVNVVTDRPTPLRDIFWWPDHTGASRATQGADLLQIVRTREARLIVGRMRDELHFSLPTLLHQWPEVNVALQEEYAEVETIGPFTIYAPRNPSD